ncbi:MAG: hypothetical protein GWP06_00945 [Actinobacteria bacterium]|nr:hypothetical protein [Actinomycetota bacterium]
MPKLLLLLFFLLPLGCAKRELPVQVQETSVPVLEKHLVPSFVNPNHTYTFSIRVKNAQNVDSVKMTVLKEGDMEPVEFTAGLYDDGGALHSGDGDVVASDGYFTNNILWIPEDSTRQKFIFAFLAVNESGEKSEVLQDTVVSLSNVPPQILNVQLPDSLPGGFAGQTIFKVETADSNGIEDVDKILYRGIRNDTLYFSGELLRSSDIIPENPDAAVFVLNADSSFAVGKKGNYDIIFEAVDHSGVKSSPVSRPLYIGNKAPLLSDVTAPPIFERPNGSKTNTAKFLITVKARDSQTLKDIQFVKMIWKKPDGTFSKNSPFTLYDNGLPFHNDFSGWNQGYRGDQIAGDGIYSITGLFDPTQPLGDYLLTFYAHDLAGNISENVTYIITLKDDE